MKICIKCKKLFSNDFEFCPKCGVKLVNQLKCPNCEKTIDVDYQFCPYCGMEVVTSDNNEYGENNVGFREKTGQEYGETSESIARTESKRNVINKSENYPHIKLSELGKEIIGLAASNVFNDNLWQAFGFKKTPIRGSFFNAFVSSAQLAKETFLRREFMIAPLGIFVGKLRGRVYFSDIEYIEYLSNKILENKGVSEALKFNSIQEAKRYFKSYINEYSQKERNLTGAFLDHCKYNNMTTGSEIDDSVIVDGAYMVCSSLSDFLEKKIKETDEKFYIEDDLTSFRFNKLKSNASSQPTYQSSNRDNLGKKYELTDEIIVLNGRTLYRIRALIDFKPGIRYANGNVVIKKGDLGGFVASENNLSQQGNCWAFNNSKIFDNAIVKDNAYIKDYAEIYGNAIIGNNSGISGDVKVYGDAIVDDNSSISGDVTIFGNTQVLGQTHISGEARVYGETIIRNSNISVWGGYVIKDRIIENTKIRT